MAAVTTTTAVTPVKKVHAEAHKWKEPNEPVPDEDVCPMLGDEQESYDDKKAEENHPDCRPPKRPWPAMFIEIH